MSLFQASIICVLLVYLHTYIANAHARICVYVCMDMCAYYAFAYNERMYVCVCIWMYTCIHIYVYVYIYVCVIYMYMCICVYICVCVCMYVRVRVYLYKERFVFGNLAPFRPPPPGLLAPSSNILSLVELTKYKLKTKHMKILH